MYIPGLIPCNFAELAEAVPIDNTGYSHRYMEKQIFLEQYLDYFLFHQSSLKADQNITA